MEYLNVGKHVGDSEVTIISSASDKKILIKTIHVTNVFSGDTTINISWEDNSVNDTFKLANDVLIPQSSSFQALDGTFTLDNLDSLKCICSDPSGVDITVSYMEINNSEG